MNRIIVSLTTWKKRDRALVKMLEHFQKQTLKPDEVILWLSSTEYDNVVPEHIQQCLDKGWLSSIRFVPGNTKCYKKWEVFKEYDHDYVILLDDDFLFPIDLVESLYKAAKEQQCPCCYFGRTFDYFGITRKSITFEQRSIKNQVYPGFCCIPPGIITRDCELFSDEYIKLRDKYNPTSDDLWFGLYFKKHNIPLFGIHEWKNEIVNSYVIEDTIKDGLWSTENDKKVRGVLKVVRNYATIIEATNSIEFAKKLYPLFDIAICSDKKTIDGLL